MSQENVELLRAGYDAVNRGDHKAWVATYHPDAELHELASIPDTGIYRGHSGPLKWVQSVVEITGDDFAFDPEQFTDAGEFTLVRGEGPRARTGGRGAGRDAGLSCVRDRRREDQTGPGLSRRGEALAAVGLSE
jgi:ketosteroid isomerase-like protein